MAALCFDASLWHGIGALAAIVTKLESSFDTSFIDAIVGNVFGFDAMRFDRIQWRLASGAM